MENYRAEIEDIFYNSVEAVKPNHAINNILKFDGKIIYIGDKQVHINDYEYFYIIGFGKASALMCQTLENILGNVIKDGIIITKYGHSCKLKNVKIFEAAHPIPDENGVNATKEIVSFTKKVTKNDFIFCLISGGGSSLLTDFPDNINLEDIMLINKLLIKSGANINEINVVRKHLSQIKGGGLARLLFPARIVSLILSDVIGDSLDTIASGPTVPDNSTFKDALEIINKYNLRNDLSGNIIKHLIDGCNGFVKDTPKKNSPFFKTTSNIIVANNLLALQTAKKRAEELGYESFIISNEIQDNLDIVLKKIIKEIKSFKNKQKCCLIFGGEPIIKVTGSGLGGRNLHLALSFTKFIEKFPMCTFLSAGTDGTDGPTDAAGAIVDITTVNSAKRKKLNIDKYLKHFDSYNFFLRAGGIIRSGPTQTNVMDIIIVLINNKL